MCLSLSLEMMTVLTLLVAAACGSAAAAAPLTLTGDAPWVVPPELGIPSESMSDTADDTAQNMALRDVELDWYKVLGYRAVIYRNNSWKPSKDLASQGSPAVFFGDVQRHPYLEQVFNLSSRGCGLEQGAEAHCILSVDSFMWQGELVSSPAVVAVGNGTRGAIFAAYSFSEHILGVAPFYKFTFDQPRWVGKFSHLVSPHGVTHHRPWVGTSLPVPPTVQAWAPPQFKHRCIFLNDEELLGFFRRDPLGEQIFDPSTVDMILETLLRAKGNTIIMVTNTMMVTLDTSDYP